MRRSLFNARAGAVLTIAAAIVGAYGADAQTRTPTFSGFDPWRRVIERGAESRRTCDEEIGSLGVSVGVYEVPIRTAKMEIPA